MSRSLTRAEGPAIQSIDSSSYLGGRYLRKRTGDFCDTTLSAKLGSILVNHLALLQPHVSGIDVDTTSVDSIALTAIPHLSDGRNNHSNDVEFGQLHRDSSEHPSTAELVATKYLHRLRVPREMHASLAINERFGEQLAFAPIGFVKRADASIGYITRYEHSVITLDNVLWHPESVREQRLNAMSRAGLWMAALHNHGIVHGDAQAKNIAFDSSNRPRYPDLERATDINHGLTDRETRRLLDITDLFNRTYMPRTSQEETVTFIDAYLENQSSKYGSISGRDVADAIESVYEGPDGP